MDKQTPQNTPEDPYRELVHEVRNLSAAVGLLHTIFVKRTLLYWLVGIETLLLVIAVVTGGIFISIENGHQNRLVDKSIGSCAIRNAQVDSTRRYLEQQVDINTKSQALTAAFLQQLHVRFSSSQEKQIVDLTIESRKALVDYLTSQPKDVDCKTIGKGTG